MKKLYTSIMSLLIAGAALAQVSVTFQVDMSGETVSPNGVYVAGNFQESAGGSNWTPGQTGFELTDPNTDGIYSVTLEVAPGEYEFKYLNGNAWGTDETQVPGVANINGNRFFAVGDWHISNGYTYPAVPFNGAAPAGQVAVRLNVDLGQMTPSENGVHAAGTAFTPNWTPGATRLTSTGNNQYAVFTTVAPNASYQYKFINGDDWGFDETSIPGACSSDGNRVLTVESANVTVPVVCFNACEPCTASTPVKFSVDLSNAGGVSADGVFMAGNLQQAAGGASNWTPGDPMFELQLEGDNVYSIVLNLPPGSYEFKYLNGNDWGTDESVPSACQVGGNRGVTVPEQEELYELDLVCFGGCGICVPDPDPADITFRVDLSQVEVSADGVWVMGGFTTPVWQPGAVQMTLVGDGIYEATATVSGAAEFLYKFANGDPVAGVEENGNFEEGGCGVPSGVGGFNRVHVRSGEAEVLDPVCYNYCVICSLVSVEEMFAGEVNLFPNPFTNQFTLELENPNGQRLFMLMYDIMGKQVKGQTAINNDRIEISRGNLPAGIYFVQVINDNGQSAVFKVIAQ